MLMRWLILISVLVASPAYADAETGYGLDEFRKELRALENSVRFFPGCAAKAGPGMDDTDECRRYLRAFDLAYALITLPDRFDGQDRLLSSGRIKFSERDRSDNLFDFYHDTFSAYLALKEKYDPESPALKGDRSSSRDDRL